MHEYLIDLNAKRAAIRAGYSERSAEVTACRMLRTPKIKAAIDKALEKRCAKIEITGDRVLQEIAKIGFSNLTDFMQWGPGGVKLKSSDELTVEQAACVSEVVETTTESGGSIRFKLHDKLSALEKLGKHLKLFTDVSEQKVDFTDETPRIDDAERKASERLNQIKGR